MQRLSARNRLANCPKLASVVACVTKEGFAADEIIALGRKTTANLVAMSSHGRSGATRWVLGGVAETVVRHSGGPVLINRSLWIGLT